MRGLLGILACAVLVLSPVACTKSRSPSVGGETNWLVRCSDGEPCEQGSCLCGVCTQTCEESAECGGDFEGRCTSVDDRAGRLLCGPSPSPAVDAVCLPRCGADDPCGDGYACEEGVCVARSGTPPPIAGSGGRGGNGGGVSPPPRDAGPDGCVPGADSGCAPAQGAGPLLERLAESRSAWDGLAAEGGDTYWYEEQNCLTNVPGGGGNATVVQVEDGVPRVTSMRPVDACSAVVNRYESWTATTMDELYDLCANLVRLNGSAITLSTDAQGVVETCFRPDRPNCDDNCGSGFALGGWAFGFPGPGTDAAVTVLDAGGL